jgi:heme/copper-type cytochrome/quinol oxidase subunit 3
MNTYKNEIISTVSIAFITLLALILPTTITLIMLVSSTVLIAAFTIAQNYDINYKYWFSFIGQLCALIFVAASFIAGLSFIANGMA